MSTSLICLRLGLGYGFNTTFNSILVISWLSVLLVKETGVPGENHQPAASHWQSEESLDNYIELMPGKTQGHGQVFGNFNNWAIRVHLSNIETLSRSVKDTQIDSGFSYLILKLWVNQWKTHKLTYDLSYLKPKKSLEDGLYISTGERGDINQGLGKDRHYKMS